MNARRNSLRNFQILYTPSLQGAQWLKFYLCGVDRIVKMDYVFVCGLCKEKLGIYLYVNPGRASQAGIAMGSHIQSRTIFR